MIGMASSQVNISQANIKGIYFPLPSKQEQTAIVEKVNGMMALCDQLEQKIESHQTTQEQWMQRCLREVVNTKAPDKLHLNIAAEPISRYGNK
jgi:type I restriction enzyme S subunit